MKIAFVANTCWNIYNFRKGLVHNFLSKGHEVIVLAPKDEYTEAIEKWNLKWVETPIDGTGTNPIKDLSYFRRISSILNQERPDVVLSFTVKSNIYSALAGRLHSIPVICNVSGLGTVFLVRGLVGKIALYLYRVAFRSAAHVFFQNEDDITLFTSYVKLPEKKIGLLSGSGIDLNAFSSAPYPDSNPIRFLMISRLIVEKGVREFAAAAAALKGPNVEFVLVGKWDERHARAIPRQELDHWISEGILKYLPHTDEIKALIAKTHALILPSYREGTSRTLLEGAAMARPLLASDVPGCREVVKDGYNGFLFEVQNPKSLIDKIKLFLSLSHAEKMQLASNSRKLAEEKFDENKVIGAYNKAIRRIIGFS